jgi:hypothetical protein
MHQARVECAAENWDAALAKVEAVLELEPAHEEALRFVKDVERRQQINVMYNTGLAHENAGRFDAALEVFQLVRQQAGNDFRSVDSRIKALKTRLKDQTVGTAPPPQTSRVWSKIGKVAAGVFVFFLVVGIIVQSQGGSSSSSYTPPSDPVAPTPSEPEPTQAEVTDKSSEPAPSSNAIPSRDAEAAAQGLSPYGPAVFGMLGQGGSIVHPVALEGGATYVIAGSCDDSCSDLDLAVSEMGVVKFKDDGPDAIPAMQVPVIGTGTYQLTVTMSGCSSRGQCGYRLQVYR